MGFGNILTICVIVLIIIVIVVLASYYSSDSIKKREKREQEEAERTRKRLEQESMKKKIRTGQLTQQIFEAIDKAASIGLTMRTMSYETRTDRCGYFIKVTYCGEAIKKQNHNLGKYIPLYDDNNIIYCSTSEKKMISECRDRGLEFVYEEIECAEIQWTDIPIFIQVLLEKLGTENYRCLTREDTQGYATNILVVTKKPLWEEAKKDWRSNPNWQ